MAHTRKVRFLSWLLALITVGLMLPFGTLALTLTQGTTTEAQYLESLKDQNILVGNSIYKSDFSQVSSNWNSTSTDNPLGWDWTNTENTFLYNSTGGHPFLQKKRK